MVRTTVFDYVAFEVPVIIALLGLFGMEKSPVFVLGELTTCTRQIMKESFCETRRTGRIEPSSF